MALSVAFGWRAQDGSSNEPVASSADASSVSGFGTVPQPAALYIEPWHFGDGVAVFEDHDPIHELGFTVEPTPTPVPPTPVPTRVVSAAAVPQSSTAGVEQWRGLVASIFPTWSVDAALRVMNCESHGNPNATGSSGERGLFQVHPLHFDSTYDPEGNVRAAYRISGGGASWAAWSCKP